MVGAFWIVAFGVFVAADDLMVVSTMLRPMVDDLGLTLPRDLDSTAWIVNVYLIAYIASMPLAGRLSDIFGRRSVFVSSLAIFAVGSIVVPTADSLGVLLVGRALTAIGGGALVPIALAVAGDLHTGAQRARAIGVLGAIETLGWVWGPMYGALLVRFLSWQWQFYLNVPLAIIGIVVGWRLIDPKKRTLGKIDWGGAVLLTTGLIALNLALLGHAKIQSVTGLDQLSGGGDSPWFTGPWLYGVAAVAFALFTVYERRLVRTGTTYPIVGMGVLRGRTPFGAMAVNVLVGVGLVISLINVPLFINVAERSGIRSAALVAGVLMTVLTAMMAATSYLGGVIAGRVGNAIPTVVGLAIGIAGFVLVGASWAPDTGHVVMALELAVVGGAIGLVLTPTSTAVVNAAADDERGSAAGLVIVFRLIGFSVGLAALTAWGVHRYVQLRDALVLPPLGSPGYDDAAERAAVDITTTALAETFVGAAISLVVALAIALFVARFPQSERRLT